MITFDFLTDAFEDNAASRAERINEGIGGAELATWLSGQLRTAGHDASAPFVEDHGWDFWIKTSAGKYLCACSIDDDQGTDRTGFVTLGRGTARLPEDDAIAAAIRCILAADARFGQIASTRR